MLGCNGTYLRLMLECAHGRENFSLVWQLISCEKTVICSHRTNLDGDLWYKVSNQTEQIHNSLAEVRHLNQNANLAIVWKKFVLGEFKMNIDGAHSCVNGASTCDDLILDHNFPFIEGFFSKVSSSSSLFANMWVLHSGIILVQDLGIQDIIFETDSVTIYNAVKKGHINYNPLLLLLKEVIILLCCKLD
ncbi:hypothetical protein TSUD_156480 [Trifolium subterraneum]|uniref:RNase H type-1 domain-containing protein n=1 Tax=Trifolium subterraneum TaxID=3900 RepID=A0A2Z6MM97_TRISU|nr:hypothetical protein TSUD_156480 [Trifolium subterraneum]